MPFLDVADSNYWLLDKSLKPAPAPIETPGTPGPIPPTPPTGGGETTTDPPAAGGTVKEFENITISGSVPLDRYTELFNYFITPFAMNGKGTCKRHCCDGKHVFPEDNTLFLPRIFSDLLLLPLAAISPLVPH